MNTTVSSYFRKTLFVSSVFSLGLIMSCTTNEENKASTELSIEAMNETIPVYNFEELEPLLYTETDKTYLINFWAMWCAPCVKEMPFIQQYAKENPDVEVILVSFDFVEDIETKLIPFLKKKNIQSRVVLLDDPDSNTWIDKIDPNWSGAIPFTIVFNKTKRVFFEQSFESLEELKNEIDHNFN